VVASHACLTPPIIRRIGTLPAAELANVEAQLRTSLALTGG